MENGQQVKGVKEIYGKTYLSDNTGDNSGELVTGWYSFDSKHRVYFDPLAGGTSHEEWKYGDPAGNMYFNEYGIMQNGVIKIDQDYYLFLTNGLGKNDYQKYGWYTDPKTGHRYYFNKDNNRKAAKDTTVINGTTYHFSQEGILQNYLGYIKIKSYLIINI
ncbi:TPA: hypothetical protein I9Z77_003102 [Clostridium perfringens]|nr:hypothetical protein [Clostridium perfringens]